MRILHQWNSIDDTRLFTETDGEISFEITPDLYDILGNDSYEKRTGLVKKGEDCDSVKGWALVQIGQEKFFQIFTFLHLDRYITLIPATVEYINQIISSLTSTIDCLKDSPLTQKFKEEKTALEFVLKEFFQK